MKKKKSLFLKIICLLMIFCTSFVFVGCMGMSPDEQEELEEEMGDDWEEGLGGSSFELDLDMYGTKVLYRPDNYNFNLASGRLTTSYYQEYAYEILNELFEIYGITKITSEQDPFEYRLNALPSGNEFYLNDSIRYQIDIIATITKHKKEGETEATNVTPYQMIGANLTNKWNWSFNYNFADAPSPLLNGNHKITGDYIYNENQDFKNLTNLYAQFNLLKDSYKQTYIGDPILSKDYVKALEYVLYCYALDLEPAEMIITYSNSAPAYSITIGGQPLETALENIINLFNKKGSFVGLTERQATKLKAWILKNIIGDKAKDNFTKYDNATKIVDADGNVVGYELGTGTTLNLGRDYESAVDKIVDGVCQKVSIGTADTDGNGGIDDEFLASEIMEYAGNTFMIAGDENFPVANGSKFSIKPLEYQSVTLMLKDKTKIDGMYIALKYDADGNGTEEGVWNLDKYLDIIVELNYFSHEDKKLYTIGSQQARVYDGPFDPYHDNPPDMYEDVGNVYFYDWKKNCKDEGIKNHLNKDDCLVVNEFNVGIGGNALMTDVGTDGGYKFSPLISNNPLVLVGTKTTRRFYSLLEPTPDEDLKGKTYVSGRLNPTKFSGSDGCDYLEITYKVLKDNLSDTSKNYKFYTGISFIY